jgi:hypothetical protein
MAQGAVEASAASAGVFLLPGFDEYLLGYKDRGAVLAAEHAPRIAPGGNGVFRPMIVSGGRIVGTWQRTAAGVSTDPFTALKRTDTKAIEAAALAVSAFWSGKT